MKKLYMMHIKNNDFYLTEEQLLEAYNDYKKSRET